MKVLIDYTQIPVQKVGVGVMALNLIKELEKFNRDIDFIILKQSDDELVSNNVNFKIKNVSSRFFRNFFLRMLLEQIYIPYLCFKYKIDKIHSLHYSFPLFLYRTKRIVTIHDLSFFLFPEVHQRVKLIYFKFFIKNIARYANSIICVSQSTKNDLEKILNRKIENAIVVYNAKSEIYNPIINKEEIKKIKAKYNIDTDRYILFIGTIEPRKNIYRLISAFLKYLETIPDSNLKLIIIGKKGWYYSKVFELVRDSKYAGNIIFTGFVDEEEKPILLKGSQFFIYPSLYEGFGIPVLEAMGCGVLTITSNVSSMPEIIKDGGILINDPSSENEIFEALKTALNINEEMKNVYISKSINYASNYTWQRHAQETLHLYLMPL